MSKNPEICKKSRVLQKIPVFAKNPEICKSRDFLRKNLRKK